MQQKITRKNVVAALVVLIASAPFQTATAGGLLHVPFDAGNFGASKSIDNPYWPLSPGMTATRFVYLGETEDGCAVNRIEAKPALVKMFSAAPYDAIMPLVVVDTAWELEVECDTIRDLLDANPDWTPEEGLAELTHDWYAEDGFENVWYLGEASRDFGTVDIDDQEVECPTLDAVPFGTAREHWPEVTPGTDDLFLACTAGSWEAGQPGQEEGEIIGTPGIVVPSDTPFGDGVGARLSPGSYFMQEVAENAQDMAKILRTSASLDDYEACRKVKEWNPFERGSSIEHKWYCADGPGLVLIEAVGGGPTETEELVLVWSP